MSIIASKAFRDHEQVSVFYDKKTGLKAIIAVHNTNLGPALGGCRMWAYENEEDAITDVLRLSRGMTYKAAITGLALGGGKSVIIGNSKTEKTPELFQAMGKAVERMAGRYIIAEDVGTSVADMVEASKNTRHVVGLPAENSSDNSAAGDPSPVTAFGVFSGLQAAVEFGLKRQDLRDLTVAVQGLGHVGYNLCKHLHDAGAKLIVTDIDESVLKKAKNEFGADIVDKDKIYDVVADVYAPCALGATINTDTIKRLKARVIAGAANNQLAETKLAQTLKDKNILYTPDYVINAGGLINVYYEWLNRNKSAVHYTREHVFEHVAKIRENLLQIFDVADKKSMTTAEAANQIAEQRFMNADSNKEKTAAA